MDADKKFIGVSFYPSIGKATYGGEDFYIVGCDYEDKIGVRDIDLSVFVLSDSGKVFVNTSLEKFLESIRCYTGIIDFDEAYDEKKRSKDVKAIRKGIKQIDPAALTSDTNWWSYILEQTEDGLF